MLPEFGSVTVHEVPLRDGIASEAQWMASAAAEARAQAHLWEGVPGWVVPRSYSRAPGWATRSLPLQVRASGGGLVPQGPGLTNLSLVWRSGAAAIASDAIYRALCDRLQAALAQLGVAAAAQAIERSFCDGRYNLAVDGRKIAGTAQAWRRIDGQPVVLAHAVLIVDADVEALTAEANAIEEALGQPRRYRASAVTSIARAWCARHGKPHAPADFARTVRAAVAERFARGSGG